MAHSSVLAQTVWQDPPEPIASMLDTPWYPAVKISPNNHWLVRLARPMLPTLADLARPRVAVAGLQLDLIWRSPALPYAFRALEIQHIETGKLQPLVLPEHQGIRNLLWSPTGNQLAFTLAQPDGLELWVADMACGTANRLTPPVLNDTYGMPCRWISEADGLLCKTLPPEQGEPPSAPSVPAGPRIEENLGRSAPARTYTNLLQSPHDEALFEYYLQSVLEWVTPSGDRIPLTAPQLIQSASPSPDGQWILLSTLQRPFSYQVPVQQFAKRIAVLDRTGRERYRVADLPLADDIPVPFDSVRTGRRIVRWRSDRPATLYWVEALDQGDAGQPAPHRDVVYQLQAPFRDKPQRLWQSELRYDHLYWGHDTLALAVETWYATRQLRVWRINPAAPEQAPILLEDLDFQDEYNDPGQPMLVPGPYQRDVLLLDETGESLYLRGRGASPAGVYPFLDRWHLDRHTKTRLWQAQDPHYEVVVRLLDANGQQLITHRQSQTKPPNFWRHNRTTGQSTALTQFEDPRPWYRQVSWQVVRYQRADGVMLSATLYLPPGHDPATAGPLPTLLWAYPQEYKSREAAAQVTTAENTFSRPYAYSPLFLLTQGYAVLMGPTMPIIGEGDAEPNDTYIEQLTQSAQAAVDYLVHQGISAPDQIAIGGHSYGAFTAANLLAHTDLFSAGIANSGAYNRTLTPFGFQGEQRTFWEAQEAYVRMSPFTYAAQIKAPLLLLHGGDDENAGTYPLQSERLYGAIKGLGGTVRWVELPLEGHGYESRQAVGHVLWEMTRWLDQYVKPAATGTVA